MLKDAASGQHHAAASYNIDFGALQAGVMVNIIPCLILFLILQRYYVKDLMGGSVK
jgi:ABC-type glycerol-3-phosphate transport system permease component